MRAPQTPSTTLIAALGLARRSTAQVGDLYNRPIARQRIGLDATRPVEEAPTASLAAA